MNYLVEYYVFGYDDLCFRSFRDLKNAIRFIKYNDIIKDFKLYKVSKNLIDYYSL